MTRGQALARRVLLAALIATGIPAVRAAEGGMPPGVAVSGAWVRATPPRATTAAAYLTLASPVADRLTGVSSPAARDASVHEMTMDGAVMRMRPLPDGLALPVGRPVTLAPDGTHLMLTGLAAPLRAGDTVLLRLTFAAAPPVEVRATVLPVGASGPDGR